MLTLFSPFLVSQRPVFYNVFVQCFDLIKVFGTVCNLILGLFLLLQCLRFKLGIIDWETVSVGLEIHLIRGPGPTMHLPSRDGIRLFGSTLLVSRIYIGTWSSLKTAINQPRPRQKKFQTPDFAKVFTGFIYLASAPITRMKSSLSFTIRGFKSLV